tara:strand:- start:201 stop:1091 length:891 start_codon:yes stop_codon:yes gene_type:complete
MGYTKPKETTRQYLESQPLPTHGKSYTVIPHARVIDTTLKLLNNSGFSVTKELYRANMNANVAQGIYHITPLATSDEKISNETELGMMFAWTNSYDKSTRFQCSIGGYVAVCYNGTCSGDLANFARKHTGSADADITTQISSQIKRAELIFRKIIDDRDFLRNTDMSMEAQAKMLGMLYCDLELLDNTQMSIAKSEMDKPSFNYNCNPEKAWTFYNHVTHALKKSHPRTWLKDTQRFHDYITSLLKGTNINTEKPAVMFNPNNKISEMQIDDTDWLEIPNTVDVDVVQNRVENMLG